MKNPFIVIIIIVFSALFLLTASKAYAACQPIYGGGLTCVEEGNLKLNKTVKNLSTGQTAHSFGPNDPRFSPNQDIQFFVEVENSGSQTLTHVTTFDILPPFISNLLGDGNVDVKNKKVTFDTIDLRPGEKRTFTIDSRIVDGSNLPDQSITCAVNQAQAQADNGQTANDNAQFCIEKPLVTPTSGSTTTTVTQVVNQPAIVTTKSGLQVMPVGQITQTPPTGPEFATLLGLIPLFGTGVYLRKKSRS